MSMLLAGMTTAGLVGSVYQARSGISITRASPSNGSVVTMLATSEIFGAVSRRQ